jgi:hypothetical protein
MGLKEKQLSFQRKWTPIFTGRLTGGSTSLVHVIGVKGTVFNVLLVIFSSVWLG